MERPDLTSEEGLRAAAAAGAKARSQDWVPLLAGTIEWVKSCDEETRATREFQQRLWEDNHVAAVGQGSISVDRALDDEQFRRWLAARSLGPLPDGLDARTQFLTELYEGVRERLTPHLQGRVPHLKIFRVIAALFPEAMTSVADRGALQRLARAMGSDRKLYAVGRHVWVRHRLDQVLGAPGSDPVSLAERLTTAWMIYEKFVQTEPDVDDGGDAGPPKLGPLPAARRRRGLSATRGLFQALLSTLEFVKDGVTKPELLDFLRASSPDAKSSSLGVIINSLQGEFDVIRFDHGRYVLSERGARVLQSQDAGHLADWLLTHVLGPDKALVELRDHGPMPNQDLVAAIRGMNPGWTTDFAPSAIVNWLRSMGVIQATSGFGYELTEFGQDWAARVHWEPEPLPAEPPPPPPPPRDAVVVPQFGAILQRIESIGRFPAALVARLHAGLWAPERRHFAVLTGLSGSGKTLLARAYAKALAEDGRVEQVLTLPVQPGWYDPGALLGYTNPLRGDTYVRTAFLDFLLAASGDQRRPYVAILDEMNLSHPEQYMAPLLSAMETGDAIRLHTEGNLFDDVPSSVPYPSNLVLIGTVNMDETTHGLSDKVLDRAFVLEFWTVDLDAYPRWGTRPLHDHQEQLAREVLAGLLEALAPAHLHFGWRVVDDVLDFLARASETVADLPFQAAMDGVIYSKVLPKLRGEDAPRFRKALDDCQRVLATAHLTTSATKVAELRADLDLTGSARFWR
jgi:hypothetical protein